MGRPGRKRAKGKNPPEAKKKRVQPIDHGTVELMQHRAEIFDQADIQRNGGDVVRLVRRQEAGDELGILVLKGIITEQQRAAGTEYARLRKAVCGSPHCATGGYGERHEGSPATGPSAADQRAWERCIRALRALPSLAKSEVDSVAVFNRRPAWLRRLDHPRKGDERQRDVLQQGLKALERLRLA